MPLGLSSVSLGDNLINYPAALPTTFYSHYLLIIHDYFSILVNYMIYIIGSVIYFVIISLFI
jgi:hypothetical protein